MDFKCVILFCYLLSCPLVWSLRVENVGTVLFTQSELLKNCWAMRRLALLHSRMILQDVLPDIRVLCMDNDAFVNVFISYFRLTVDTVKRMTFEQSREIMLLALSDALGGYMHHAVIPLAKHAYYMGNINYDSVTQVYALYAELKGFLRSNGRYWMKPIAYNMTEDKADKKPAAPLSFNTNKNEEEACAELVYYEDPKGAVTIPVPFLDSEVHPNAIAVPFRTTSLYPLQGKNAAYILVKYYLTAIECLLCRNAEKSDVQKFDRHFNQFINDHIMNHVNDERLYSSFGSVYRILASLNETIPVKQRPAAEQEQANRLVPILIGVLVCVIAIWLLAGIIYCCCRMRRERKKQEPAKKPVAKQKVVAITAQKTTEKRRDSIKEESRKEPRAEQTIITTTKSKKTASTGKSEKKSAMKKSSPKARTETQNTSTTTSSTDKPMVFGYDFERSSTDFTTDDESSKSTNSPMSGR